MKKEIVDAFERLIHIPEYTPEEFSLEKVWNAPMITLTKEMIDVINKNNFLEYYGYDDEESLARLIGTKCYFCSNNHKTLDEKRVREIFNAGNEDIISGLEVYLYDEKENSCANDIADFLNDETCMGGSLNDEIRWHTAIALRVCIENGGDIEQLIEDAKERYQEDIE